MARLEAGGAVTPDEQPIDVIMRLFIEISGARSDLPMQAKAREAFTAYLAAGATQDVCLQAIYGECGRRFWNFDKIARRIQVLRGKPREVTPQGNAATDAEMDDWRRQAEAVDATFVGDLKALFRAHLKSVGDDAPGFDGERYADELEALLQRHGKLSDRQIHRARTGDRLLSDREALDDIRAYSREIRHRREAETHG